MNTPLHALIVEVSEDDAFLLLRELQKGGFTTVFERVETPEAMAAALEKQAWDVIISGYVMPHFDGLSALRLLQDKKLDIPFILVSGKISEETAVEAMKAGAHDYLAKGNLQKLATAVRRELQNAEARQNYRRMAGALREVEERFRAVAETAADAIICLEEPGLINFWNTAAEKMFGYSTGEARGKDLHDVIVPERFREKAYKGMKTFFQSGTGPVIGKTLEISALRKNGAEFPVELSVSALKIQDKWQATAIIRDISQRKQTEESLLWELKVNTAMADVAKLLITSRTIGTTSSFVLETARQFTGSESGFVGYIDPQMGCFVSPTFTGEVWEQCHEKDKANVFQKPGGLFGWVLKNRKPLLTNTPAEDPRSMGTPSGLVPIHRFLSVPSLLGETLVGQIAVANSGRDYTDKDAQFLERLATLYAIAVQHTREEDKLHHEKELTARLIRFIAEEPVEGSSK